MTARSRRRTGQASPGPHPANGPGAARESAAPATRWEKRAAAVLALAAALLAGALSRGLLAGIPRVGDEVSYALQGRIFASGRLFLVPPEVPEAFRNDNVILTPDRWCSKYPPGFPLLLAAGWRASVPWAVNPILFGLATLGVFRLGARLYGGRTALLGAFLFATLPFAFLQAAGFMAHVACLATAVWALALVAEGDGDGSPVRLFGAGLLAGLSFITRPGSAVFLLALPGLLLVLRSFPRGRRFRAAGLVAAGGAAPLLFLLFVQARSFGSPLRTGYAVFDPEESFFGNRHGQRAAADILARNAAWYAVQFPRSLWAVPGPPLWWLALLLLRPRREDAVVLLPAACLAGGYLFHYYHDLVYGGPRFLFESTGFLAPALAASAGRGVDAAWRFLPRRLAGATTAHSALLPALLLLLAVGTVVRSLPLVMAHGRSYMGVPNDPMAGSAAAGLGEDALVLVDFRDPRNSMDYTGADAPVYSGYFFRNALDPAKGGRVFARAVPGQVARIRRAYPRRETWIARVRLSLPTVVESPVNGPGILFGIDWRRVDQPAAR